MRTIFGYPVAADTITEEGPRLRRLVLLIAVAGVPLMFFRGANDPFNTPKLAFAMALVGIALALKIIEAAQTGKLAFNRTALIACGALAGPLLIAWIFGAYRGWSLFGEYRRFQGLIPYLIVILLGLLIADAFAGHLRELAWAVAIGGGVAGTYAVSQYLGVDLFNWGSLLGGEQPVTSTLGNTNFSGGFLGICLPVVGALALTENALRRRAGIVVLILFGGLAVSVSQGGWLAATAGSAVLLGFYLAPRFRWAPATGFLAAGALCVAVVGVVVVGIVKPGAGPIPETVQFRSYWWEEAVDVWMDSPVVGRGPNAFAIDVFQHRIPDDSLFHGLELTDDPHSVPLSILTGAGALGLAGFLVAFVLGLRIGWRRGRDDLLIAGFAGALVAYFAQSLASIDELTLRMMFWVALGALLASEVPAREPRSPSVGKRGKKSQPGRRRLTPIQRLPVVLTACVLALAIAAYGLTIVIADGRAQKGFQAFRSGEVEEGSDAFESALSLWPNNNYRQILSFFLADAAIRAEEDGSPLMERALDAWSYLDGFPSLPALRDKGLSLSRFAQFVPEYADEASEAYARVVEVDPLNAVLVNEAIVAWKAAEDWEYVSDFLADADERLFELDPSLWGTLALAYAHQGAAEEAMEALDHALAIDPSDPTAEQVSKILGNS